ncbi:helix-turn-helix transcriptional regulator [Actinomyces marmotae]
MSIAPQPSSLWIPKWTLADYLRKARLEVGMSQRDFAAALDAKPGTYAQWEAGNTQPRDVVALAKRIELLTRIPAAWILGLMDGPQPSPDGLGNDGTPAVVAGARGGLPRLDSNQQPSD